MGQLKLYWRLFIIIVLLGAVSLACGFVSNSVSQNPQVKLSPAHKIVYDADRGFTISRGIYAMKPDGSDEILLVPEAMDPVWSPDGTRIAFITREDKNQDIFVTNLDGSGEVNLTNHPEWDSDPAWSPDGKQIAFYSLRDEGGLFIMNSDGSNIRHISTQGGHPVWLPNGTQIGYVEVAQAADGSKTNQIFVMNVDGSNPVQLTHLNMDHNHPVWSPDGTRIAFSVLDEETLVRDVYVMNADGSNPVNITSYPDESDEAPVWSPDGTKIAFMSWRNHMADVYVINPDGTGLTQITTSKYYEGNPDWRP